MSQNQVNQQAREAAIFELLGRHAFENAVLKGEVIRLQQMVQSQAGFIPKKPEEEKE